MTRLVLTFFVFLNFMSKMANARNHSAQFFIQRLERNLEVKFYDYANSIAVWLEGINDRHLKGSDLGRFLRYEEMKPKLNRIYEARGSKKLSLALLPIIFHVGATTSWLAVTTILSAKSVAIGLLLLIFKIAVSSAKISSFFTAWKLKKHHDEMSWLPHHDHHASHMDYHYQHPHKNDWGEYKTLPNDPELEYGESKKVQKGPVYA